MSKQTNAKAPISSVTEEKSSAHKVMRHISIKQFCGKKYHIFTFCFILILIIINIIIIIIIIIIITIIKVVTAGEGVEDAEEGGGSVAQVWRPRYHCCSSIFYDYHHPSPPHCHHHHKSSSLSHDDQAVLSLAVTEEHIAGLFKCEAKHAATSKSLFNVTKIDVQCNHFHHGGECDSVVTMIILIIVIILIIIYDHIDDCDYFNNYLTIYADPPQFRDSAPRELRIEANSSRLLRLPANVRSLVIILGTVIMW